MFEFGKGAKPDRRYAHFLAVPALLLSRAANSPKNSISPQLAGLFVRNNMSFTLTNGRVMPISGRVGGSGRIKEDSSPARISIDPSLGGD